ncbi:MAG: glutamate--tRNA ligase [Saccharofermentanales bacterium]|jgi:glutamyl-tRNA synthetase|nr:glutamate--tRNA ligase [Bacillota bacterium]NLB09282.1 glutamate--tRNA ligase [Clostridiales bacterium]
MSKTKTVRTRFAPSPTGFMHIGNLRSALYAYLIARSNSGQFILRIEDTDQERIVEGSVEVIYQTLRACGLHHDEGPDMGGPYAPYVQSERKSGYLPYAEQLVSKGKAYYCFCGKERISDQEFASYDRNCRDLPQEIVAARLAAGEPYAIRQKMPLTGFTTFSDEVFGEISVANEELEDQILIKSDGFPTYNFANVIDDYTMGITHVVRGSEYLSSTPKYNLLYEALGWEVPVYVHLPLILGEDGSKLSKRHGATSFAELLDHGYLSAAIINYIAFLGWSPGDDTREIYSLRDLEQVFSISGISKSPAVFSMAKLDWFNEQYLRAMQPQDFADLIKPLIDQVLGSQDYNLALLAALLQPRITRLSDIPEQIDFFVAADPLNLDLYRQKRSKLQPEVALIILTDLIPKLSQLTTWEHDEILSAIQAYVAESGYKLGQVMGAIRPSLSGRSVTPGGAVELMLILDQAESMQRLEQALVFLQQNN